jgi:hypothetical protein
MVVEVRLISYFRSRSLKIPQGYSVTDDAVAEKRTKRQNTTTYYKVYKKTKYYNILQSIQKDKILQHTTKKTKN